MVKKMNILQPLIRKISNRSSMKSIRPLIERTRSASGRLTSIGITERNTILNDMAAAIIKNKGIILSLNRQDVMSGHAMRLSGDMMNELFLDEARIEMIAKKIRMMPIMEKPPCTIPDSLLGETAGSVQVIALIYESRPYITAEAAAMCLRSSHGIVLRGGKEAFHSNTAIASIFCDVLQDHGLPRDIITLLPTSERVVMAELIQLKDLVDLIIPCGSEWLIQYVLNDSKIPVVTKYNDIFHL